MSDEMKFPLENKEALESKDLEVVSKYKLRIYFALGIVGYIASVLTAYSPTVQDLVKSEDQKFKDKYEAEQIYKTKSDSLQEIIDQEIQEKTFRDIVTIYERMDELRKELPTSSQASIYYTHDSGGVPVTGSPLNITVLYSSNNVVPCLGKSYWQNRPLTEGLFNYNYRIHQNGFYYVPDVVNDKDIYKDNDTREDIDCNGRKAMMGILIKKTAYAVYYLSVNWDIENPYYTNHRTKTILMKYAAELSPLIQTKTKK